MYHSCILRSGVHACPTTGYTAQHVEYGGYTDGRSCTACGCGDVSASACAPSTVDTYVIAGCTGAVGATYTPLPDACAAVPDFTRSFEFESEVDPKAGCAPSGGAPEGSVTPTEPTTLCCQP
jgi:hypothetical protein